MAALVQELIAGGRDEGELEHRAFHKNGTIRWQVTRCSVAAREGGRAQRVLGTTIDITARKQAEEALRRSEARFRCLADSGMIGFKVGDAEGRIVAANDAFLALAAARSSAQRR
jgi:PAS domain-containing protein